LPLSVVGEMSAGELMEWTAYERLYGPILPHERIDVGLAQVSLIMARMWGGKNDYKLRDFMPGWYQELTQGDAVRQGFEALMRTAENKEGTPDAKRA
jgi:hypothetical protein